MNDADPPVSLRDADSFAWALCFEIGLGGVALLIGSQWTQVWPAARLDWPPTAPDLLLGLAGAIPMLLLMLGLRRIPLPSLVRFHEYVDARLTPLFQGLSWWELALLSAAAGWGEELLFRGLLQDEVASHWGTTAGLLIASFLFALVHFITPAYFVLAFVISLYLGWLYVACGSLWVPMVTHGSYDFLMLWFLMHRASSGTAEDGEAAGD